jgi:tRNA pseudouridine38-40 synthase
VPRFKLTLEYDGTGYVGWQVQQNGPSVQAKVQDALEVLLGERVPVVAAGRTDSGVHALGQVAAFTTSRALPLKAFRMGLNGILPPDIAVVDAQEVREDFDPRRWSLGKRYRYLVSNRRARSPLRRRTHWEIFAPLETEPMREAARCLVGRHDFSGFRAADCQAHHAVRELRAVTVQGKGGDEITFEVEGTAFLKHMVRNLVGSLVEVGKGRRPVGWMAEVLGSKDRTLAGPTAPAHGLVLVEVQYGEGPPARLAEEEPGDE